MKIASYCSNRTVFPPPQNVVAANAHVMLDIVRELIRRKHDVTIYASKGSHLEGAKIVDLNLGPHELDYAYQQEEWVKDVHIAYRLRYLSELYRNAHKYDLIHLHVGRIAFGLPFTGFTKVPTLFTIHENFVPQLKPVISSFKEANLISISNAQRKQLPGLNYVATIYHGVNPEQFPFVQSPKKHYIFMSRISKEKGVESAIRATKEANVTLEIYGPGEERYLNEAVYPHISSHIRYKGMVDKYSPEWFQAYGNAKALIFPIQWEEPFGLVLIEALAAGTPVIAFRRGSAPEIIKDGVTGFLCAPNDIKSLVQAIKKIETMPALQYAAMRRACREHVEKQFTIRRMVDQYEAVYDRLIRRS